MESCDKSRCFYWLWYEVSCNKSPEEETCPFCCNKSTNKWETRNLAPHTEQLIEQHKKLLDKLLDLLPSVQPTLAETEAACNCSSVYSSVMICLKNTKSIGWPILVFASWTLNQICSVCPHSCLIKSLSSQLFMVALCGSRPKRNKFLGSYNRPTPVRYIPPWYTVNNS